MISCITKKPKILLVSMARKEVTPRLINSIFSHLLTFEPRKIKKDRHNGRHSLEINTTIIPKRIEQCYCRKLMKKQLSEVASENFENIHVGERLHTIALNRRSHKSLLSCHEVVAE